MAIRKSPLWCWLTSVWLLPAVPEGGVVFDLIKGPVELAKLVPDTLDGGPRIGPIAVGSGSGAREKLLGL